MDDHSVQIGTTNAKSVDYSWIIVLQRTFIIF